MVAWPTLRLKNATSTSFRPSTTLVGSGLRQHCQHLRTSQYPNIAHEVTERRDQACLAADPQGRVARAGKARMARTFDAEIV